MKKDFKNHMILSGKYVPLIAARIMKNTMNKRCDMYPTPKHSDNDVRQTKTETR